MLTVTPSATTPNTFSVYDSDNNLVAVLVVSRNISAGRARRWARALAECLNAIFREET